MEQNKPQPIPDKSLELGHEVRDVSIKAIVWLGIGVIIMVFIAFVAVTLLYGLFEVQRVERASPPPPLLEEAQGLPPQPLLQRNPATDMEKMRQETDGILNNYGWVDKQTGIVRIPITRAMELTLERGLPTRPQSESEK